MEEPLCARHHVRGDAVDVANVCLGKHRDNIEDRLRLLRLVLQALVDAAVAEADADEGREGREKLLIARREGALDLPLRKGRAARRRGGLAILLTSGGLCFALGGPSASAADDEGVLVDELRDADDLIAEADRHAQNCLCAVARRLIDRGVKTAVGVCLSDVHRLAGAGHVPRDAALVGDDDSLAVFEVRLEGLPFHDEDAATIGVDEGLGGPNDRLRQRPFVQVVGREAVGHLQHRVGLAHLPPNILEEANVADRQRGDALTGRHN